MWCLPSVMQGAFTYIILASSLHQFLAGILSSLLPIRKEQLNHLPRVTHLIYKSQNSNPGQSDCLIHALFHKPRSFCKQQTSFIFLLSVISLLCDICKYFGKFSCTRACEHETTEAARFCKLNSNHYCNTIVLVLCKVLSI